jgi:hypothetical protein
MMGVRTPETCWAVHKRQAVNLRKFCNQLVDLFELYDDARTCKIEMFLGQFNCASVVKLNFGSIKMDGIYVKIM